jgi:hypothetical protein
MEGYQTPRIDWECEHCHAHRYDCVDCGTKCIDDDGAGELCELCFRNGQQATELKGLKRGDWVLMPASVEHAKAMHLVAERYLRDNNAI